MIIDAETAGAGSRSPREHGLAFASTPPGLVSPALRDQPGPGTKASQDRFSQIR
jgi:hypothetical protein